MRRTICAALGLWIGLAGAVAADSPAPPPQAVVVELFTSQGCSSCPPADGLLAQLADHDGVIALALHVDYWDYIGWKDKFGKAQFTQRQKAYARAEDSRTIYTPQMIVDGTERVEGFRPMRVADLIHDHRMHPGPVRLDLMREGDALHIKAVAEHPLKRKTMVQLVRYIPSSTVTIGRGENAGRTMTYRNIVTSWRKLADWDGASPLSLDAQTKGQEPIVVIVQDVGPGPILAAGRLR